MRPQFIKAATVFRAIRLHRSDISEIFIHTGQHFDDNMSEVFLRKLEIPKPHYNLCIGGEMHGQNTGRMSSKIKAVLSDEKPDWAVVVDKHQKIHKR